MDRNATIADIKQFDPAFDPANRSDAYLAGVLSAHKARAPRVDANERVERFGAGGFVERTDGQEPRRDAHDVDAARQAMKDRQRTGWQKKPEPAKERTDKAPAVSPEPDDVDAAQARARARMRGACG